MANYVRKTRDLWDILGDYGHGQGWEVLTCATSLKEKNELIRDYRENENIPLKSRKYREIIA
jgi:hypothetical protein